MRVQIELDLSHSPEWNEARGQGAIRRMSCNNTLKPTPKLLWNIHTVWTK